MIPYAPRHAVYAFALILTGSLAYDVFQMPIQVSDSLRDIVDAHARSSILEPLLEPPGTRPYFRPLRETQIKLLLDMSGGHYHLAYRGLHAALLALAVGLFVRALRVRTGADAAAAAFAVTMFVGLHTFTGAVASAYPINHFLIVVVLALLVLNLVLGPASAATAAGLVAAFVCAALTLETGLLIWVVAAAAWWAGAPGVSRRTLIVLTVGVAAYLGYRLADGFVTRTPDAAGFLLERLEPEDVARRFGDNPLPFYAYNVLSSLAGVLFAEPRSGVFVAVRDLAQGELLPRVTLPVVAATSTTAAVGVALWRRGFQEHDRRLLAIFGAVLLANAAMSYAYTKDEIMSVAGAFFALAGYAAVRTLLSAAQPGSRIAAMLLAATLATASVAWALRAEGLHYALYIQAFKHRNDWIAPAELSRGDERTRALVAAIRSEVLTARQNPNPRFVPSLVARWFEEP